MGLTYVQLKQAIQDWTENDGTEFTAATGSGTAPIDVCIANAELRIMKELDLNAFRKTVTISLSANTPTVAMPEDLVVLRFLRIQNGDMLYEKDETFIREFTKDPGATAGKGTVQYYSYQRPGTQYTTSNRYTNIIFAPTPSLDTTCEIGYTYRVPGLSASTANTYLGDRCQDTLLYACLIEAAIFMKDPQQLTNYQQLYERSVQTLGVEEQVRMRNTELYKGELRTLGRLEGDR